MLSESEVVERVRVVIRRKHLRFATERSYCGWVARFYRYARTLPGGLSHERKFEAFLTMLARERSVSASTQNQAFNAIVFLFKEVCGWKLGDVSALRAKRREHARHAPSREDVVALLRCLVDTPQIPARLVCKLLYGSGLRVNEALELRLKDVRLQEKRLVIRGSKGTRDRLVMIPDLVLGAVKRQMQHARHVFAMDQARHPPLPLEIPLGLARKYPRSPHTIGWAFLFPSLGPQRHPRTGELVRWHLRDREIQRACRKASDLAGLDTPITPHCLRHGFGTHFAGDLRDLQALLGHKSLETTQVYRHPEIDRTQSPLDSLPLRLVS